MIAGGNRDFKPSSTKRQELKKKHQAKSVELAALKKRYKKKHTPTKNVHTTISTEECQATNEEGTVFPR